jgi:hypothetical protein
MGTEAAKKPADATVADKDKAKDHEAGKGGMPEARQHVIGVIAQAQVDGEELAALSTQGVPVASRAQAQFSQLSVEALNLLPMFKDVGPDQLHELKPLVEKMLGQVKSVGAAAGTGDVLYLTLESAFAGAFGPLDVKGAAARPSGVDSKERESTVVAELDAAHAALAAAVEAIDPLTPGEPQGDLGTDQLARASLLMRGAGDHASLVAQVQSITQLAGRLPDGKRKDELYIRLSDARQAVGLERLVSETMSQHLAAESEHTVSPAQREGFEAAVQQTHDALWSMFDTRMAAVRSILAEAQEKDPPKPPSIWAEIAIAALAAAASAILTPAIGALVAGAAGKIAGGVAAKVAGKVVDKAMKVGEKIGGKLGEEAAKEIVTKMGEKVLDDVIKKSVEGVAGGEHEGPEGPKNKEGQEAHVAAGGESIYFKDAFFARQEHALIAGRDRSVNPAMAELRGLESRLSENPEAMVAAAQALAAAARQDAGEVAEIQRAHSRIGYVKALAVSSVTKTTHRMTGKIDPKTGLPEIKEENKYDLDEALDLDKSGFNNASEGVISLGFKVNIYDKSAPVELHEAWVYGLNEGLRDKIAEVPILKSGMPVRARSEMLAGSTDFVSVARDPAGGYKGNPDKPFKSWLAKRGGSDDEDDESAYARAAEVIIKDLIGDGSLNDKHVKLEAP